MGFISQFDLGRIIREYKLSFFFETGTWKGDAVQYALQFPFEKIVSAEIVPPIAEAARARFEQEDRVIILEASSVAALTKELPLLSGNCLFWLDAHFPGADAGLEEYDAMPDEAIRLPLENELAVIHQYRTNYGDVIIIDDLRVYEDGPFENGEAPADTLPKQNRNTGFVYQLFGQTHEVFKSYKKEGYLLLLPKIKNGLQPNDPNHLFFAETQ
jgi:hypothetical protein